MGKQQSQNCWFLEDGVFLGLLLSKAQPLCTAGAVAASRRAGCPPAEQAPSPRPGSSGPSPGSGRLAEKDTEATTLLLGAPSPAAGLQPAGNAQGRFPPEPRAGQRGAVLRERCR